MGDWIDEIQGERRRAEQSRNPGRTRTAARRIAGIALQQLPSIQRIAPIADGFVGALRSVMDSAEFPNDVRQAAFRLQARLSPDFSSPSTDPIGDAMIIANYVRETLEKGSAASPGSEAR